jgi:hypothetical protein
MKSGSSRPPGLRHRLAGKGSIDTSSSNVIDRRDLVPAFSPKRDPVTGEGDRSSD